jgi:PAS domain S-box-containing protein
MSDLVPGEHIVGLIARIRRVHPYVRLTLSVLLVCAGYYLGGVVGIALMFPASPIAIIWLPNAILLAVLLLTPVRMWWVYLLAAIPAHLHLVTNFQPRVPLVTMLCQVFGNIILAVIAALAVRRFAGAPPRFESLRSLTAFILLAAIAAPCVVAALVAYLFLLTGWVSNFWIAWRLRFLANVFATLTITPLIVLTVTSGMTTIRRAPLRRYAEFSLLTIGLFAVGIAVFGMDDASPGRYPALLYTPLPFLLWAAVRFGPSGLCLSLLVVAFLSLSNAIAGRGPFVAQSPAENVLSLQIFLVAVSLPLMLLAALMEERRTKEEVLQESEERFRHMADYAPVMIWMTGIDKLCTFFNKGWLDFTGRTLEEQLGNGWAEGVHRDDYDRCFSTYVTAFDARREFTMEYRLRRFDREYCWVLDNGVPRFAPDGRFIGYIGSAIEITERKRAEQRLQEHEAALRASYARIQDLAGQLITAQEAERARIARELHDDINQQLASLSIAFSGLKRRLPADAVDVHDTLARLQQRTITLADAIHHLLHELHPGMLQHAGLVAA